MPSACARGSKDAVSRRRASCRWMGRRSESPALPTGFDSPGYRLAEAKRNRGHPADIGLSSKFPGQKGLDEPHVFVFATLLVCLNCGHREFAVPEHEWRVLKGDVAAPSRASSDFKAKIQHAKQPTARNPDPVISRFASRRHEGSARLWCLMS